MGRMYSISSHPNLKFTRRWFENRNLSDFVEHVLPRWQGKLITYLEIGCFEAMSACWILEFILTHPDAKLVSIDPHLQTRKLDEDRMEQVRQIAINNLSQYNGKGRLIRGNSDEVLARMHGKQGYGGVSRGSIDLAMIDGNHRSHAVLADARAVYRLMKPGGWIIFDDVRNDARKRHHVREGLDWWLDEVGNAVEHVWSGKYTDCFEVIGESEERVDDRQTRWS